MLMPLSALKEFLETKLSLHELADKLTAIGIEVESLKDPVSGLKEFVTARIDDVKKHPDADKLSVLQVSDGKTVYNVVCGAPNVKKGLIGVFARIGTVIPINGQPLKKGVIRGVESNGMMCAEDELSIGTDHNGIIELPLSTPVGVPFSEIYAADPIIEVKVTPNRGDCLGVYGIARDLSAAGAGTLKPLKKTQLKTNGKTTLPITIKTEGCKLFSGRLIKGVKNGESPQWMKDKLVAFGLRPISALVDITNYMTMMYNRPMHVFDADKVKGGLVLEIESAGKLEALDDKTYELVNETIVIKDENGIQSLAGIIGGVPTAVSKETKNIILESAYFSSEFIARAGRKLGIQSDARYRFERGVDPQGTIDLEPIAVALILEICGGTPMEANVAGHLPETKAPIAFSAKEVERVSGVKLSQETCDGILKKLGLEKTSAGYIPPSFRSDLSITEDLVEEVLRLYGYESITPVSGKELNMKPILTPAQKRREDVIRALAGLGLYQTITYSFADSSHAALFDSKKVRLKNPMVKEQNELRPSLLINLIEAVGRNQRKGVQNIALFEMGPVFSGPESGSQKERIGMIRAGNAQRTWQKKQTLLSVFDVKADVLSALAALNAPAQNLQITTEVPSWYHPARSGACKLGKNTLAFFGELHPRILKAMDVKGPVVIAEIMMENLPETRTKSKMKALKTSDLQTVKRDFSFMNEQDVPAEKILQAIRNVDKVLITEVSIFDVFEKSVALEVILSPTEKTLTDAEIDGLSKKIIDAAEKLGVHLRK